MTDETRPEGRTPSGHPEPQGRPEFLPAGDRQDGRPPAPGGDDAGETSVFGTSHPYDEPARPGDTRAYEPPGPPPAFGHPGGESPSFGNPSVFGHPGGEGPSFGHPGGERPSFGNPSGEGPSFGHPGGEGSPYGESPRFGDSGEGPPFGHPSGERPSFGHPGGEGPGFGNPGGERPTFGHPGGEGPAFGNPGGEGSSFGHPGGEGPRFGGPAGENAYATGEWPFFGSGEKRPGSFTNPSGEGPFGGSGPPPPPNALPMGANWAPPPGATRVAAPRRGPSTPMLLVLALVVALVASGLGSVGTYLLTRPSGSTDPSYSLGPIPTGNVDRAPTSVAGVAARVLPSVVSLEVGNGSNTEGASGSGFLIKNGYVVTNNHVVALAAGGGDIKIMFNNRKTTTARIVGRDPGSDLAVLKPEETFGTPEITLGNSDQVVVGDPVIAIGSPLGLTGTVTTGIVSSLNRPVIAGDESGGGGEETAYISAIQTDAAINPGNSGGPLVNGRGEVVGVNSAIATLSRSMTSQSGSIGLGFAIPVNQTRRVAEELITTGKAKRPKIGIVLDTEYRGEGVRIASGSQNGRPPIDEGGPAEKAGLKPGDIILEVDGLRLQDGNELIALIRSKAPGAKINIKYERDNEERTATLVVSADAPTPTPS
ncbi:trypsin-like peptidase domain-containing protein [Nonomuraea ferruginea]|uniref:Trypsin-like peptidase domain-containing protein n=1 Tax=Nonomuraea ferruginea TaxID=46174 RepID=A0ABT4SW00_9ACTN|nr:trypsin-like peptidase domain-containing protein [Nonomuraea ferruginea]MDA0641421.1 trypsin-like peptidase domain-containing protein [Nonomuraea ferruginea]